MEEALEEEVSQLCLLRSQVSMHFRQFVSLCLDGFPEDYDMMPPAMAPVLMQNRMIPPMGDIIENDLTVGLGGPGMMPNYGGGPDPVAMASLMSYVSDKDNFQPQGW